MSHTDNKVKIDVIDNLHKNFGSLEFTSGDEHTFLGLNYTIDREKKVCENVSNVKVELGEYYHWYTRPNKCN